MRYKIILAPQVLNRPAGMLIGFESEEDWLEYRLETDPRFVERIARARAELREGRGVRLEDADL